MKRSIPWIMIWLRVALCPTILWGANRNWSGPSLGAVVLLAFIDDIYDGILARRWEVETPSIRLADSCADTIFYLGAAGALWLHRPEVLRANVRLLVALFAFEVIRYAFDFIKFRKAASYHSYLAKLWGLVMAVAIIIVLSFGSLSFLVRVSLCIGIAANLEGLAMSLLLPHWQNDVKTLTSAWNLRKIEMKNHYERAKS